MAVGDGELVGRIACGDEEALAELLRRWEQPLLAFLDRYTGGVDVEDLYQETWLRVVRNAGRFDARRRFSTWLFQIGVNLCRDWSRRRKLWTSAAERPTIATLGRVEARVDARRLLARLPEAQREVLILRYEQDLAEAEIARIVGCPRGTVKSRLHNALARLGEIVREEKNDGGF